MAPCLDARHNAFRFVVLLFNCLLTFGSYFCFDMPSVLQSQFQGNTTCKNTSNPDCCSECLGMDPNEYNLLYAIYAWTNAVVVIGAGFLIDKLGNRVGAFLFSFLCVLGSSLFAAGAMMKGTAYLLPLMLIGRLVFGAGNGSLTIVQNRITSYWFHGKELAMAFGFTLAFSRLGSVLNFFLTELIEESIGLVPTLWFGAGLCGLGFVSAVVVSFLDMSGLRQLQQETTVACESKKVKFTHIRYFSLPFWMLCLTIMFFYNGVFPFVADASKFIQDKYGYTKTTASYMAGAVYDVSMVISPFLGGIIDVFGKRGYLALACALLTIPVFGLLAFTNVYPLVSTLWLGVTYSVAAASMWPSIPLVVNQATLGTALGITTSVQMVGIGISNLVVGEILGSSDNVPADEEIHRWKYVMIYLLANVLACVASSVMLNLIDIRQGGVLNLSRKQKLAFLVDPAARAEYMGSTEISHDEPSERSPLLGAQDASINRNV